MCRKVIFNAFTRSDFRNRQKSDRERTLKLVKFNWQATILQNLNQYDYICKHHVSVFIICELNSVLVVIFEKKYQKQLNKKLARTSRYSEKKLPGLAHFFIFLSPTLYFRVFSR